MPKKSFLDCPHNNVQDWTDICLDCGYNVNMTRSEYLESLREDVRGKGVDDTTLKIRKLEKRLGVKQD